ncbi:MAG: helix-turn-helix domain-containing protein [Erysipelotrichaceae bacterium]|nr:helix-turn-helix domain-containing protein [Erysipelotrichaceae bacterium]
MTENYSKAILALRVKLNLTQEKLGEMLGVSYASINRWERGHFEPTILVKERLKKIFKENEIELEGKE